MTDDPLAAWWDVISGARWFAGKGLPGTLTAVTPQPWLTPPGVMPAVRAEIATIGYADARTEYYLLLVGYTRAPEAQVVMTLDDSQFGPVSVVEAAGDPPSMRALLRALTDPDHPAMQWAAVDAIDPEAATKIWPGEQSNTTICLGTDRLFKLFRRLEPGRNLDVEVLTALNGSGITPALYGALVGSPDDGVEFDFGMFVERLQGVTDGWEWACQACAADRGIRAEAAQLGHALRGVHRRLADAFGTSVASGDAQADVMARRLDAAAAQVSALADVERPVLFALRGLAGSDLITQRVHGDFHLGQTLRSDDGWAIIDFEGEPLKSLAERKEFDSVWRDVAGMLRSFDYVRSSHPDPSGDAALAWSREAAAAFLDGYCQGNLPDQDILDAYVLDKAVYEVVYEARNRPDWVPIPLGAVREVAARTPVPTHNDKEI